MNNFEHFLTPEQALKLDNGNGVHQTLKAYQKAAEDDRECSNCDEKVWRYGGCGLCFSCTTGEADASEDYELIPKWAH